MLVGAGSIENIAILLPHFPQGPAGDGGHSVTSGVSRGQGFSVRLLHQFPRFDDVNDALIFWRDR